MREFLDRVAALAREGASFAVATVVARRAPVSAHLGDRAIVFADGRMEGFVGGACSHEIIRRQALDALRTRSSRLVSIRPDASESASPSADHVVVPMTCVSEGAVDVNVEPFLQPRRLVVVGATPVADALARLARSMDTRVIPCRRIPRASRHRSRGRVARGYRWSPSTRIASVLQDDGSGSSARCGRVARSLRRGGARPRFWKHRLLYVGLVASRKRGATVRADLEAAGVAGAETICNPAGLDLGARTPAEIALSILAEIVQRQPSGVRVDAGVEFPSVAAAPATAVDPVCQMTVEVATARHSAELGGVTYYFCCPHCRARFVKEPHAYLGKGALTDAAAIRARFRERAFIVDEAFATGLQIMLALEKPLLIEGPAGVGKTESAKVLADVLGTRLIRLQCYEGLDAMAALYEWNYPRADAAGAAERERRRDYRRARGADLRRGIPAQAAAPRRDYPGPRARAAD